MLTPELTAYVVFCALVAAWVYADSGLRGQAATWERVAWLVGTVVALPIFLPIYLLAARPPGRLTRCPSCSRPTLAHRAACRHCGTAIAFEPPPQIWGLGEVVGIAAVFLLAIPTVLAALNLGPLPTLAQVLTVGFVQSAIFAGLSLYVALRRYALPPAALGIRVERWPAWTAAGIAAGLLAIPLSMQAEELGITLIGLVTGRPRAEEMADQEHLGDVLTAILQGPLTPAQLALVFVLVCGVVPVAEEIFFRGFLYGALRRWGVSLAAALSALLFAAVHSQIVHFLPIFLLGIIMALLYERTGSLIPPVVVHAVNNVVATLAVLYGWKF